MTSKEIYKELKATLLISVIVGIIFVITYLLKNYYSERLTPFLIGYFGFSIILIIINAFLKNKHFEKVIKIISFPFGLIYAILIIVIPFGTLLFHLIFYFAIAIVFPEIIFKTLNYFHLIDFIKRPTEIYLKITMTVFICVLLNSILRDIVCRISPVRSKASEKMKPYELNKLTDYFLSTDNVRFLIYTFYVIALLTTNYFNFQGQSINSSTEIDKSILQSFVTFIAFDRVITLLTKLEFSPSRLLEKIRISISNKLNTMTTDDKA